MNEAQTRRLASTVRGAESWLSQIERVADDPAQGTLVRTMQALAPEQRQALHQLAGEMREDLARIAREYDLPSQERDQVQTLRALASTMWQAVLETKPAGLRGFGELDEAAAAKVAADMSALIEITERMFAVLR